MKDKFKFQNNELFGHNKIAWNKISLIIDEKFNFDDSVKKN